jgi:thiamine biosynthesis lipoprotein
LKLKNCAVATSGIYERGNHILNPKTKKAASNIVSLTVICSNILDADRFATAAFCMGKNAINFIEKNSMLEGYMIDNNGIGTSTSGLAKYLA